MLHEDGTMDVEVDGKMERRRYTLQLCELHPNHLPLDGVSAGFAAVPETHDGEEVFTYIGRPPAIFTRAPRA